MREVSSILKLEAADHSETFVPTYQTTLHNIPENNSLQGTGLSLLLFFRRRRPEHLSWFHNCSQFPGDFRDCKFKQPTTACSQILEILLRWTSISLNLRPVTHSLHAKINTMWDFKNSLVRVTYCVCDCFNPYPTAFPYGNGMVLHVYQQQESSTTKTVHKVINKGLKAYV